MHNVKDQEFDRRLSQLDAHSRKIARIHIPSTTLKSNDLPASSSLPLPQQPVQVQNTAIKTTTAAAAAMITTTSPMAPSTSATTTRKHLEPAIDLMPASVRKAPLPTESSTAHHSGLSSPPLSSGSRDSSHSQNDGKNTPTTNAFPTHGQSNSAGSAPVQQLSSPPETLVQEGGDRFGDVEEVASGHDLTQAHSYPRKLERQQQTARTVPP